MTGRRRHLADAGPRRDPDPQRNRSVAHQPDDRAPAADRVPRGGRRRQKTPDERLPQERRRQFAGIVVVGEHAAAAREDLGRLAADEIARPRPEGLLDRRPAPSQPQRGDGGADRRDPPDLVPPAKPDPGQRRAGVRREQPALAEPAPQRADREQRVWPQVRLVGAARASGPATELVVRLDQPHRRAVFGRRDRRGQARDPASNHRDHRRRHPMWQLARR